MVMYMTYGVRLITENKKDGMRRTGLAENLKSDQK